MDERTIEDITNCDQADLIAKTQTILALNISKKNPKLMKRIGDRLENSFKIASKKMPAPKHYEIVEPPKHYEIVERQQGNPVENQPAIHPDVKMMMLISFLELLAESERINQNKK